MAEGRTDAPRREDTKEGETPRHRAFFPIVDRRPDMMHSFRPVPITIASYSPSAMGTHPSGIHEKVGASGSLSSSSRAAIASLGPPG